MDTTLKAVLGLYGAGFLVFVVLLVFVVVQKRKKRWKEDFEKRDN